MTGVTIAKFMTYLTYSRTQENEADRLALLFMNKAGFNMEGAVSTLNKFKVEAGENSKWKEWLSTHPHPENRLKNVQAAIAKLKENPNHVWGGLKDDLIEKAKVKAIKIYLKRKKMKEIKNRVAIKEKE
jgi:predicted Zn-dependent protease